MTLIHWLFPWFTILLSYALGRLIVRLLNFKLARFFVPAVSLILGTTVLAILTYGIALMSSFVVGSIVSQTLVFLLVIYATAKKPGWWRNEQSFDLTRNAKIELIIILCVLGFLMFRLLDTHIIPLVDGVFRTGESTYGDLPFHLTIISQMAYGNHFPPENPFYTGLPLAYPYFANLYSAILVFEGWSLRSSILIPGLLFALALFTLLYDFAWTVTKRHAAALLTLLLYVFNGGLGFYFFLRDNNFKASDVLGSVVNPSNLQADYSHLFAENIQWSNFLTRMIIPERSILLGIPVGLIILRLLFFRDTDKPVTMFEILLIALLLSAMPLLHTHTVVVFAVILPLLALAFWKKEQTRELIRRYGLIILFSVLFALPHVPLFLGHVSGTDHFFSWHWGWMKKANESFLWFWFKNTGFLIPVSFGIYLIPKLRKKNIIALHGLGLLLFLILNLMLFQPYAWDNIKFLLWGGLFLTLAASLVFVELWKHTIITRVAGILLFLTLTASAGLSLERELTYQPMLFDENAKQLGEIVRTQTPKDAIFLTPRIHNNFANNLAGRKILMGYPGALWVHGIDYSQRESDVLAMYAGTEKSDALLKQYGVDYVVVPTSEDETINKAFFTHYPVFQQTTRYIIFRIPNELGSTI